MMAWSFIHDEGRVVFVKCCKRFATIFIRRWKKTINYKESAANTVKKQLQPEYENYWKKDTATS
jgi:hypothetical protein